MDEADNLFTTEYVTSKDGTSIGFRRHGVGPGIVLVQGAMGTEYNYKDLAIALGDTFTVITPDRRGRGMSPKEYSAEHEIARDVEDLDALLAETGASWVFGLSSGAMITLEATRTLNRITKASVYEPPFYPNGISHDGIRQLNQEIEQGEMSSALTTALQVANTAPAPLRILPTAVARLLARAVLFFDDRKTGPEEKLRDLLPGIRYDFNVVGGMDGKMNTFSTLEKPMLLISGTSSAAYLLESIRKLQGVLPQAKHVELVGLDHSGSWNSGSPGAVAEALKEFFL